jgi:hypothetical protein
MAYDKKMISEELTQTALGTSYFGNSLYVARDIPCLDNGDKEVLNRWLAGTNVANDSWRLQDIANKIKAEADKDSHITAFYTDRNRSGQAAITK